VFTLWAGKLLDRVRVLQSGHRRSNVNSIPYLPPIPETGEARVMWFAALWHAIGSDAGRVDPACLDAYTTWLCEGCRLAVDER
jgi:hypothetical protein